MEVNKQNYRCKCGINNCVNTAEYCITGEGVMPDRQINICKQCAKELAEKLIAIFNCDSDKAVNNEKRNNQNFKRR